jgi:hypothetical protein
MSPAGLADTISAHMSVDLEEKAAHPGNRRLRERLNTCSRLMDAEIDLFQVEKTNPWAGQKADGEKPAGVLPE